MDCLLLADDLTGAADACVKFVACGYSGSVLLTLAADADAADASASAKASANAEAVVEAEAAAAVEADVIAINTDTRRLAADEARRRIGDAAQVVARWSSSAARPAMVFKKIDSTLRGHIGAELLEALQAFDCTHAIFAPAFPAMGRTVRDGRLFVGSDEAARCDIATLLADQGVRDVACVRVDRVEGMTPLTTGARVLMCDAVTQRDLDAIVRAGIEAMSAIDGRPLWVGSAGLAQALATHLASQRAHKCPQPSQLPRPPLALPPLAPPPLAMPPLAVPPLAMPPPLASPPLARPPLPLTPATRSTASVLLFIGSPHAVTHEQLTRLLDARDMIHARDAAALRDALAHERHVLVTSPLHQPPRVTQTAAAARDALLDTVRRGMLAGFVMSGGDTAVDLCRLLGADRLRLGGEVADGIPWGLLQGGPATGLPLVLKSGGFGHPDALIACVDFLMSHAEIPR